MRPSNPFALCAAGVGAAAGAEAGRGGAGAAGPPPARLQAAGTRHAARPAGLTPRLDLQVGNGCAGLVVGCFESVCRRGRMVDERGGAGEGASRVVRAGRVVRAAQDLQRFYPCGCPCVSCLACLSAFHGLPAMHACWAAHSVHHDMHAALRCAMSRCAVLCCRQYMVMAELLVPSGIDLSQLKVWCPFLVCILPSLTCLILWAVQVSLPLSLRPSPPYSLPPPPATAVVHC